MASFFKIIRLILISAVIFFLLLTAISLFFPSHVRLSRATNLAPGTGSVLQQVADLNAWKKWHPFFENKEFKDTSSLNRKVVKATTDSIQLTVVLATDSLVTVKMQRGSRIVSSSWRIINYTTSDSLTLQNYMDFDFKWYPWEKFSSLLLEPSFGPVMEKGLTKLKTLADESAIHPLTY